jgi:hypothetical protein
MTSFSHSDQPDRSDQPELAPYWQQAALLFQPALIRLLDQIRNQLANSPWQGTYETRELWPAGAPELPAEPDSTEAPQILYLLYLSQSDQNQSDQVTPVRVNIWELCYQICFQDYQPQIERETIADFQPGEVTTDTHLLDADGEVDWHRLDRKAEQVVAQLLQKLSAP